MIAEAAVKNIMAGAHIFIGTGCDEPQVLVHALADGLQMVLEEQQGNILKLIALKFLTFLKIMGIILEL